MRRAACALALLLLTGMPAAAGPDALWRVVHGQCDPDQQAHRRPAPCAVVDDAAGFAVLKDLHGADQYLLIPTVRIGGIESPSLLRPDAPNYFAAAWSEMPLVEARLHRTLPREDLSLAINSAYGRTQDQLHIHMECISPSVRDAVASELGAIRADGWHELPRPLMGHRYRALRIEREQLDGVDPFRLLAASLSDPAAQMGHHTLVLVGARLPRPGFVLLDDRTDLLALDHASGEELQDHDCAVARRVAPG